MRGKNNHEKRRRTARRRGFSLVELMTVIAVLGLLMSIIVPALGKASVSAKVARTKTLFDAIAKGIEMYRSDGTLENDYPPSRIGDPNNITVEGAQTLLWGLAGSDLLGTPGFGSDPNEGPYAHGYVCSVCNSASPPSTIHLQSLHYVDGTGKPVHSRRGPFVDVSKAVVILSGTNIPPVLTDDFGQAILYFKANRTQTGLARYNRGDNASFLGAALNPATDPNAFMQFIWNTQIGTPNVLNNTLYRPHNYDSYILISAGPDKKYGTADDITNYPLDKTRNVK